MTLSSRFGRTFPVLAFSENCNVAVSLREMGPRLAERDGYYPRKVGFQKDV